jgi:hypothetical protein
MLCLNVYIEREERGVSASLSSVAVVWDVMLCCSNTLNRMRRHHVSFRMTGTAYPLVLSHPRRPNSS